MNDDIKRAEIKVFGRVQGVGYRYFCFNMARKFGLNGYAKNIIDGSVESIVEGKEKDIKEYIMCLKKGPHRAFVEDAQVEFLPSKNEFKDFKTL